MSFVTDGQLFKMLADRLKILPDAMEAHWAASIVPQANEAAYQDVVRRLMNRGFKIEQIDQWDWGREFQQSIGLFYCLMNGGAYAGYDPTTLAYLDRREELDKTFAISIGGKWVSPDAGQPGLVVSGGTAVQSGIFDWPTRNPNDAGDCSRW